MTSAATAAKSTNISRAARVPSIYQALLLGFEKLQITVLRLFPATAYHFSWNLRDQ
jgi:hypothetical protein